MNKREKVIVCVYAISGFILSIGAGVILGVLIFYPSMASEVIPILLAGLFPGIWTFIFARIEIKKIISHTK